MVQPPPAFRIGLAASPWPIFNRPSLQLGALKSYVEARQNMQVDTYHLYLPIAAAIGGDLYTRIARSGWAGEALFAPLLFPEMRKPSETLFLQSLAGGKKHSLPDFAGLVELIDNTCAAWLAALPTDKYLLIGFSVSFFQLLSSLYLARRLKEMRPELPIVFGGSSCAGEAGASLIANFPEIDYLVDGEGEEALCGLCRFLLGEDDALPANIRRRETVGGECSRGDDPFPVAVTRLNDLPPPDYSPYFMEMHRFFPEPFIPTLPVEFSRGCWWNRCTFCNLNLQWQDYRAKTAEKMTKEVLQLAQAHESLQFVFVDNALPVKEADLFFTRIGESGLDFEFFGEIRPIADPDRLRRYRQGGLRTIQAGIEALSTSLLQKMSKGTTVLEIMAVMKTCSESGIRLEGNLITEFPTTTETEIAETLTHLEFLWPFPPLQAARFFLGYGSPIYARSREFSIRTILSHAKNRLLFPEKVLKSMTLLTCGYRGDRVKQRRLWRPVCERLRAWREYHLSRENGQPHPLSWRDGGSFLIIRQERPSGPPLLHRLRGKSREIYLFCRKPESTADILLNFPSVSAGALEKFLAEMTDKRLMFVEGNRVLALAVRDDWRST